MVSFSNETNPRDCTFVPNAAAGAAPGTIPEQGIVVVVFRKERRDDHALIVDGYFRPFDGDPCFAL